MALNMTDPAAIMSAYSSVLDNDHNWLLLHYISDSHDELGLHSFGDEGLEELKTKLSDLDEVFIAFYREEIDVDPGYIIVNYIPPSVSGVKRARALVHSRQVGAIFKKHQTIFTVDSLSLITSHNIHQAINNPNTAFPSVDDIPSRPADTDTTNKPLPKHHDIAPYPDPTRPLQPVRKGSVNPTLSGLAETPTKPAPVQRDSTPSPDPNRPLQPVRKASVKPTLSGLADATNKPLPEQRDFVPSAGPSRPLQPVRKASANTILPEEMGRRSFTTPEVQPPYIPLVPPLAKGASRFANFLRRKKNVTEGMEGDLPPPTPPKDKNVHHVRPVAVSHSLPLPSTIHPTVRRQRSRSMSDFAIISHVQGSDDVVIESDHDEPSNSYTLPLRGKWSHEGALPKDPEERARRRRELQLQREREEQEALAEEAERQRRIKLEKEAMARQELEEEARRKAEVEQEIRWITAERKRREQMEREEEERHRQELEERKRVERERRLEEHRRMEEWRKEQAKREETTARQVEEAKRREEAERRKKIQEAETRFKGTRAETELTGWITVQSKDALSWKRRFYKFVGSTIFLYRSPKDLTTPLEKVALRGKLRGLKEWNEGYDDLEAIAFSFVVEFKNSQPDDHWSMYADSEEEKYKVLGLFKVAAGL